VRGQSERAKERERERERRAVSSTSASGLWSIWYNKLPSQTFALNTFHCRSHSAGRTLTPAAGPWPPEPPMLTGLHLPPLLCHSRIRVAPDSGTELLVISEPAGLGSFRSKIVEEACFESRALRNSKLNLYQRGSRARPASQKAEASAGPLTR
jgi:hypothetical protein